MKQKLLIYLFLLLFYAGLAQVGIGTTSPTAALEINAANEGLLIPRVELTGTNDMGTVATPTASELVYNTASAGSGATAVTPGYYYLSTAAGPWVRMGTGSGDNSNPSWQLTGNRFTNPDTHFLGTIDGQGLSFRTSDTERMRVSATGNVGIGNTNPGARLDISSPTLSSNPLQDGLLMRQEIDNQFSIQTYLDGQKTNQQIRDYVADANYILSLQPVKGRVGIGTLNPAAKFDLVLTDANPAAPIANFSRVRPDGVQEGNFGFYSGLGAINYNNIVSAGDKAILFHNDANPGVIANSGLVIAPWDATGVARGIKIMESGNVGIGTAAPVGRFDILAGNSDGIFFNQYADNQFSIQTYIDGQQNNIPGYAGDINYALSLQPIKGNVGIGTTTPAAKLDVAQGNGDGLLVKQDIDDQFSLQSYLNGQKTNIDTYAVDANYRLSLQPIKGRVGIGTMNPGAKFDTVLTDNDLAANIASFSRVGTGSAGNFGLYSGLGALNYNNIVSAGDKAILFHNDANPGAIANSGLVIAPWDATGVARGIKIMESGNVGIGTAAPVGRFDILAGNSDGIFFNQYADNQFSIQTYIDGQQNNIPGYGVDANYILSLQPVKGNVGIGTGTTMPTAKLQVNGDTRISNLGGAGNRVVMADATGLLSTQTVASMGDHLGNHTATEALKLNGQAVVSVVDGNPQSILDGNGGWHRTYGNTGWFNGTWGGGMHMSDPTWIRTYGGKNLYSDALIRADGGLASGGLSPGAGNIAATGTITAASAVYTGDWFYNTVAGRGSYNVALGNHFAAVSDADWRITGNAGSCGLGFGSSDFSTIYGYTYGDAAGIGFLSRDRGWAIRWLNNNTEITGNVGIGTATPVGKLDILAGNSDGIFFNQSVDNQFTIQTYIDGQQNNIPGYGVDANYHLSLQPIKGNVGIGTLNPTAKLHTTLTSNINTARIAAFIRLGSGSLGSLGIYSGLTPTPTSTFNSIIGTGDKLLLFDNDGDNEVNANSGLVIAPYSETATGTGIRIMENGNVAIGGRGTTAPVATLQVTGTTLISSLAGSGNRYVGVRPDGTLYAIPQAAPSVAPGLDDEVAKSTIDFSTLVKELQGLFPVTVTIDRSVAAGPVDYSVFSSYLLKGVKQQQEVIKQQEGEIKNLKMKYNTLLERVEKLEKK